MDYCHSNLEKVLASKSIFEPKKVKRLAMQIGGALYYLQQNGFAHRNLKPSNILIDAYEQFKLSDFSENKINEKTTFLAAYSRTEQYMSPELYDYIFKKGDELKNYFKSDVFTYGLILLEVSLGSSADELKELIQSRDQSKVDNLIEQNKTKFTEKVFQIVKNCLKFNINDRYDFNQLQSMLIKKFNKNTTKEEIKVKVENKDYENIKSQYQFLQTSYFEVLQENKKQKEEIAKLKTIQNDKNQKQSYGVWEYQDGTFEGIRIGKSREIFGTFTFKKGGHKYIGEWKNNQQTGLGSLVLENGNRYVGEYEHGKLKKGYYQLNQKGDHYGETYFGDFLKLQYEGQGAYFFNNGSIYQGDYKGSKKNGFGKLYFANGNSYIGQFKDNQYHGNGQFYMSDGNKWIGTFSEGKRIKGILHQVNFKQQEEEFENGKLVKSNVKK